MKKALNILIYITAAVLISVVFCSYFSFNYFYLYAHIESFSDFVFCMVGWLKLAGIAVIAAAVFLKSRRFCVVLKYFYIVVPLLSLFWLKRYTGLSQTPVTDIDYIYYKINSFMPAALIKALFIAEAVLMSLTALLVAIRDGYHIKSEAKKLIYILPAMAFTVPLNLLENLVRDFNETVYNIFLFKNFTVWHFAALAGVAVATIITYFLLVKKDRRGRYRYLSMMAVVLLIQYMSRASMLIGDGYNIYHTIISFAPLFVCNIGVFVAAIAVFTKNRVLSDMAFFVHMGGALSVFVYFGKEGMSNYGTIFSYTFLYFVLTHAMLFILCIMPVLLGEQKFTLRRCIFPLCYYAVFIVFASVMSQAVSSVTFSHGSATEVIYPNFSFTQNSPIEHSLPQVIVNIFGLKFDMLYLPLLFSAYAAIFFATYLLYYFTLGKRAAKRAPAPRPIPAPIASLEAALTVQEPKDVDKSA